MIKIGLKSNAAFLFQQMQGDCLGGSLGGTCWVSILHVTNKQFNRFKATLKTFGGDVSKSLQKSDHDAIDYDCYFVKS